jgi:hypothetical protein
LKRADFTVTRDDRIGFWRSFIGVEGAQLLISVDLAGIIGALFDRNLRDKRLLSIYLRYEFEINTFYEKLNLTLYMNENFNTFTKN